MIKNFIEYIPKLFETDQTLIAFSDIHQSHISSIITEIKEFRSVYDPVTTKFVDDLGEYLRVELNPSDSEVTKRRKIASAIQGHKSRSLWEEDVKIKIDIVAGGDSKVVSGIDTADWILLAGEESDLDDLWAIFGTDGINDFGLNLNGAGDEVETPGVVFIDVDNSSLTESEVESIKELISDSVPAYYRVKLGYEQDGGFVFYANGIIG